MIVRLFLLPIVTSVLIVTGCDQPKEPYSELKAVIGEDERAGLDDGSRYAGVGVLFTPSGTCTATAIAHDQILSAAHCLGPTSGTKLLNQGTYFFALKNAAYRSQISGVAELDPKADTVILTLETPSPAIVDVATDIAYDSRAIVSLVQYDPNLDEIVSSHCPLPSDNENAFYGTLHSLHNCDSAQGASGAPLILDGKVIGIHHGFDLTSKRNIASLFRSQTSVEPTLGGIALSNVAWDQELQCGTDCYKHCRRKVLGNWVPNPVCEAACVIERESSCSKEVKVCGISLSVSALMYAACVTATSAIPPACTGMTAPTAGSSCAVSVGTASGFCGVSVGTLATAASACIATSIGVDPSNIKLEW